MGANSKITVCHSRKRSNNSKPRFTFKIIRKKNVPGKTMKQTFGACTEEKKLAQSGMANKESKVWKMNRKHFGCLDKI